ncbi:HxlR family transcriptional regulator [Glaciihabitans tibetensis]|uniref:HxlR family transcriptional regulator n=1 Tax=Glaciihabitans tibetensis TaxID=1266600 RepID=A0A2T0VI48_9MICO|nr:BTAD domain-containing putative transcriptional regulator [Glaciihabitans tibetensis]PRY69901.1 HxlR family transcriptional regulator [Glaciihabitans tibetensis]
MLNMERWTLLIVREALLRDTTRFADFQNSLGVAPELLATRLDDLVGSGVMHVTPEAHYELTSKGRDLESTIVELSRWSDRWANTRSPQNRRAGDRHAQSRRAEDQGQPWISDRRVDAVRTVDVAWATVRVDEETALLRQTPRPREAATHEVSGTTTNIVTIEISLLGAFALTVGGRSVGPLSIGSQRLLVFLALHDRAVGRAAMAGRMWPDATDERAGISLRSALSRLDGPTREAILAAPAGLSLASSVIVDLRAAKRLAARLVQPHAATRSLDFSSESIAILSSELLPDWYDDWVIAEAEEWRQVRMNALEALATALTEQGRLAEAAAAARAAMKVEPLRESAHATLIRVHLAEGNQSEALRVFERYRLLLITTLGLEPTERLSALVSKLTTR